MNNYVDTFERLEKLVSENGELAFHNNTLIITAEFKFIPLSTTKFWRPKFEKEQNL